MVYSRINIALANHRWHDAYELPEVSFLTKGDFAHTPMLMCVYPNYQSKKPFRFHNMWGQYDAVIKAVRRAWSVHVHRSAMYKVCKKLKGVKLDFKTLNMEAFGDAEANVIKARDNLLKVQNAMQFNLDDHRLINE